MPTAPRTPAGTGIEERVLAVVAELVGELRGERAPAVGPGDSLEADLGINSLERVELLVRLERAFGVPLGEGVLAEAETPSDLAAGVAAAEAPAAAPPPPGPERYAPRRAGAGSPAGARSIVDALAWHVERAGDRTHIHLRQEDGSETPLSYAWLWDEASKVASGIAARGLRRGDAVAIMLRTEPRFFPTFVGTLMAGCVPVPLYPPFRADRIVEYARRQTAILQNAGARLLVTFREVERLAGLLTRQVASLESVAGADGLPGEPGQPRAAAGDDPALIQYTSGSTGHPKGVLLSHGNLLANIRAIERRLEVDSTDVAVSWLPLYHDMGLIGAWLGALYFGVPLALMSPLAFLARPVRWLRALDAHRGTLSPAPNFAFDLCTTRIPDRDLEGLDLSSVRVLLNGSEAVLPDTIRRFVERFEPYGLDPTAVLPVYGLAECTVGLSTPPLGRPQRIDWVHRATFQSSGHAAPSPAGDPQALGFVSCGRALPGHELGVVDADGTSAPERREGRVRFRGPSATRGYYRDPGATRAIAGEDGWLQTGDLGYIADGELFLTGRSKDLIIKGGSNLYPHEAEAAAGAVPGVRAGCVAAFGAADPERGTERFVIVAETRETGRDELAELRRAVTRRVTDAVGIAPDRVVLAPPGSVSKTSSGKIQRAATRDAWLQGRIGRRRAGLAAQWLRLGADAARTLLREWCARAGRLAFTVWVVTLVAATAPVAWALVRLGPGGRRVDRIVGRWTRLLMTLAGCRVEVAGRESTAAEGPAVFVANHASYLDSPLMMSVLPGGARFAVKARLTGYPILGMVIRHGGHIPLHKDDQSQRIEGAGDLGEPLLRGERVFVFPEGTFDEVPRLLPFRLGAFRAAVDADCPVVPVAIRGARRIFPAETWLLRPGRVAVTFGPPLRPSGTGWSEIVRLRDEARAFIAEHCGES
ncbi:MAG: AMP-binding protein [Acidobacteria bacterium]|nr:AMP-binding protein [Acidobacteriota bacterium]